MSNKYCHNLNCKKPPTTNSNLCVEHHDARLLRRNRSAAAKKCWCGNEAALGLSRCGLHSIYWKTGLTQWKERIPLQLVGELINDSPKSMILE